MSHVEIELRVLFENNQHIPAFIKKKNLKSLSIVRQFAERCKLSSHVTQTQTINFYT